MKYSEMVKLIECNKFLKTRYDVVSYLIGYKGIVTTEDWENINKLYLDLFINE